MSTDLVLGHYRIIREIARSNDVVYEALDTRINRRVAIKEMLLPAGATESVRQDRIRRFLREARAAGSLTHPNIVTIYETEEENGRYFIVMEYLEGENLRQRLEREGALPVEEACRIILQVLEGLSHAHSKGVIHRDIKPENIHLLPDGRVVLTDFGIARLKFEPNITLDGQIFGTPSYMSPEQVMGQEIDERSDIFSVGVVFYEMVAGFKPFTGDSVVSIAHNILNTEPPAPPGVPYAIEWVIRRALQKSPANRFQSAEEMKKAVQDALESLKLPPVLATPMGPTPPPAPTPTGGYSVPIGGYPTAGAPVPTVPTPAPTAPPPATYIPPPPPPKPLITPATRQFLGTLLAVLLIGGAILGVILIGVYSGIRAYQQYGLQQQDERLAQQYQRAEQLYNEGRYMEAARIYYELLQQAQSHKWKEQFRHNLASSLTMYGNQLLRARRYAEAAQVYTEALNYKPLPAAYVGLAQAEEGLGNYEGAINHYLTAAEHAPPSNARNYRRRAAQILLELAEQAYSRGDRLEALKKWQWVTEIAPGTDEAALARQRFEQTLNEPTTR
jgi:serine/threonine-protein kinase